MDHVRRLRPHGIDDRLDRLSVGRGLQALRPLASRLAPWSDPSGLEPRGSSASPRSANGAGPSGGWRPRWPARSRGSGGRSLRSCDRFATTCWTSPRASPFARRRQERARASHGGGGVLRASACGGPVIAQSPYGSSLHAFGRGYEDHIRPRLRNALIEAASLFDAGSRGVPHFEVAGKSPQGRSRAMAEGRNLVGVDVGASSIKVVQLKSSRKGTSRAPLWLRARCRPRPSSMVTS